jgi:hypothetical protein
MGSAHGAPMSRLKRRVLLENVGGTVKLETQPLSGGESGAVSGA